MYETGFIGNPKALLFFSYGLVFFSIGTTILFQPRGERPAGPSFWLLGGFGILHGISEWLTLLTIVRAVNDHWESVRLAVTTLSFLCLFEFGRRLMVVAASHARLGLISVITRPDVAYLLPAIGAALAFFPPGFVEPEASIRYTLGFPGAVLSGAAFLYYGALSEVVNDKLARRGLRIAGFAFLAYAIAAGLVVKPSDVPLAPWIAEPDFQPIFVPIELIRTLIGIFLLVGLARLIQTFNTLSFNRLLEARGEAASLRQQSELVLELVDEGVCGLDDRGNIEFVNAAAKRMLGYADDTLLGIPFSYLCGCDTSQQCRWHTFPHADHCRSDREFLRRRDGTQFPAEYTSAPRYEGTRLTGAVLAFRDISERRRREVAERWEQEERFGALFEQAAVGMAVIALDGRCMQVNARLSTMLDYPGKTLVGSNFLEFIHPEEQALCTMLKVQLMDGTERALPAFESRCIRRDGSNLWVQFSCAVVRNYDDKLMYCFLAVEDISERKEAERIRQYYQAKLEQQVEVRTRALARSNKELEAANRELEAFSYSVSHDLRSPLRSINGFTHALIEEYGHVLGEEGSMFIERVRNATARMSDLIDSLLNLSRVVRSELSITTVDLSRLAEEVVEQLQQTCPGRAITLHIEQGLQVEGDPTLLRVLLQNLLDNAWKFTAGRAHANVSFGRAERKGGDVYFVRDNGVGFETQYVHKLFEPFQRLHKDSEFEGIGIGLATVRRIVQRHHGTAWAEGAAGSGATIYFTLSARTDRGRPASKDLAVG